MIEPRLPPSKFGAGYTAGGVPAAPQVAATIPSASGAAVSSHPLSPSANPGVDHVAAAAFVLVVLFGPFVAPLTLPMSYVAGRRIGKSGQSGAGLAKAAKAISYVYLALAVVVLGLYLFVVRSAGLALV